MSARALARARLLLLSVSEPQRSNRHSHRSVRTLGALLLADLAFPKSCAARPFAAALPDEWDQSIGDGAAVVVVARQLGRERALFVEDARNQNGDGERRGQHPPKGTQRDRHCENEPRAAPAYIGRRRCAYGPVEITRCPASTVIVEAANVFSRNTTRKKPKAAIMSRFARITIAAGTCDQPKRRSSPGTISSEAKIAKMTATMIFCLGRDSAPGPNRIRRLSSAGSRRIR